MAWYGIIEENKRIVVTSHPAGKPGTASKHEGRVACKPGATRDEVAAALKGLLKPNGVPNAGQARVEAIRQRLTEAGLVERTFAANLREAMTAAGVTQEGLARAVDVTLSTVSRWYRGRNKPDLDKLDRIAEALGTEASELVRK